MIKANLSQLIYAISSWFNTKGYLYETRYNLYLIYYIIVDVCCVRVTVNICVLNPQTALSVKTTLL